MSNEPKKKLRDLILDNLNEPMSHFCKAVGVNRTTIHLILNNNYQPSLLITKKICNYFNVYYRDYV